MEATGWLADRQADGQSGEHTGMQHCCRGSGTLQASRVQPAIQPELPPCCLGRATMFSSPLAAPSCSAPGRGAGGSLRRRTSGGRPAELAPPGDTGMCPGSAATSCSSCAAASAAAAAAVSLLGLRVSLKATCPSSACSKLTAATSSPSAASAPCSSGSTCPSASLPPPPVAASCWVLRLGSAAAGGCASSAESAVDASAAAPKLPAPASSAAAPVALGGWLGGAAPCTTSSVSSFSSSDCRQ